MQPFFEIKIFKLHFTVSVKFLKPNFSLHIIEFSVDTDQSFHKNVQCEVQLKFSKKSNIFISIISKGEKQSYILKVFAASNGFKDKYFVFPWYTRGLYEQAQQLEIIYSNKCNPVRGNFWYQQC